MNSVFMPLQSSRVPCGVLTSRALEGLSSLMNSVFVLLQMGKLKRGVVARSAFEPFYALMDGVNVPSERVLLCSSIFAYGTLVVSFTVLGRALCSRTCSCECLRNSPCESPCFSFGFFLAATKGLRPMFLHLRNLIPPHSFACSVATAAHFYLPSLCSRICCRWDSNRASLPALLPRLLPRCSTLNQRPSWIEFLAAVSGS